MQLFGQKIDTAGMRKSMEAMFDKSYAIWEKVEAKPEMLAGDERAWLKRKPKETVAVSMTDDLSLLIESVKEQQRVLTDRFLNSIRDGSILVTKTKEHADNIITFGDEPRDTWNDARQEAVAELRAIQNDPSTRQDVKDALAEMDMDKITPQEEQVSRVYHEQYAKDLSEARAEFERQEQLRIEEQKEAERRQNEEWARQAELLQSSISNMNVTDNIQGITQQIEELPVHFRGQPQQAYDNLMSVRNSVSQKELRFLTKMQTLLDDAIAKTERQNPTSLRYSTITDRLERDFANYHRSHPIEVEVEQAENIASQFAEVIQKRREIYEECVQKETEAVEKELADKAEATELMSEMQAVLKSSGEIDSDRIAGWKERMDNIAVNDRPEGMVELFSRLERVAGTDGDSYEVTARMFREKMNDTSDTDLLQGYYRALGEYVKQVDGQEDVYGYNEMKKVVKELKRKGDQTINIPPEAMEWKAKVATAKSGDERLIAKMMFGKCYNAPMTKEQIQAIRARLEGLPDTTEHRDELIAWLDEKLPKVEQGYALLGDKLQSVQPQMSEIPSEEQATQTPPITVTQKVSNLPPEEQVAQTPLIPADSKSQPQLLKNNIKVSTEQERLKAQLEKLLEYMRYKNQPSTQIRDKKFIERLNFLKANYAPTEMAVKQLDKELEKTGNSNLIKLQDLNRFRTYTSDRGLCQFKGYNRKSKKYIFDKLPVNRFGQAIYKTRMVRKTSTYATRTMFAMTANEVEKSIAWGLHPSIKYPYGNTGYAEFQGMGSVGNYHFLLTREDGSQAKITLTMADIKAGKIDLSCMAEKDNTNENIEMSMDDMTASVPEDSSDFRVNLMNIGKYPIVLCKNGGYAFLDKVVGPDNRTRYRYVSLANGKRVEITVDQIKEGLLYCFPPMQGFVNYEGVLCYVRSINMLIGRIELVRLDTFKSVYLGYEKLKAAHIAKATDAQIDRVKKKQVLDKEFEENLYEAGESATLIK